MTQDQQENVCDFDSFFEEFQEFQESQDDILIRIHDEIQRLEQGSEIRSLFNKAWIESIKLLNS